MRPTSIIMNLFLNLVYLFSGKKGLVFNDCNFYVFSVSSIISQSFKKLSMKLPTAIEETTISDGTSMLVSQSLKRLIES